MYAYRRIIKLPDEVLDDLIQLLDEKRITFEAAYIVSGMKVVDAKWFINRLAHKPSNRKVDLDKLKKLQKESKSTSLPIYMSEEEYREIFIELPIIVESVPRIPEEARKFRGTSPK